jgi:predicted nicotinamide N-methyase
MNAIRILQFPRYSVFRRMGSRRELIKQHCCLTNLCGINLYLITSGSQLHNCTDETQLPFPEPWWAFAWPGGLSIARYILEFPEVVKNKTVLDIGSGCGITSLAAALAGADSVVANDIDLFAEEVLNLNIYENPKVKRDVIQFESRDLLSLNHNFMKYDVIFCGDMLYDAQFSDSLLSALSGHQMVIFGDPGRVCCPKKISKDQLLAVYPLPEGEGFPDCRVFRHK